MSSLFICIKQKSDFLKNNYILIILVDFMRVYYDFFATRTRFHVSWSGSGSGQMIRIQPDPDPKHCFHNFLQYNTAHCSPPPREFLKRAKTANRKFSIRQEVGTINIYQFCSIKIYIIRSFTCTASSLELDFLYSSFWRIVYMFFGFTMNLKKYFYKIHSQTFLFVLMVQL